MKKISDGLRCGLKHIFSADEDEFYEWIEEYNYDW